MLSRRARIVSAITRRYPFYSGGTRVALNRWVGRIAGPLPEVAWVPSPGGELLATLHEYIGKSVFFCGDLDPKLTWVCDRVVRPGDTVVDVGANLGLVMLRGARLVGSSGRVLAFEPHPALVPLLQQTIGRNGLANTRLHPVALGPSEGEATLNIIPDNLGECSLVRHHQRARSVEQVRVRPLSTVLQEEGVQDVRLLKLDVEGFEAEVLEGARAWFGQSPPDTVLFEFLDDHVDCPYPEHPVIRFLDEHDYQFLALPRQFVRMRLVHWEPDSSGPLPARDFLAVRRGPLADQILRSVRAVKARAIS